MAGDWIKMRMDLISHPKVVRIMSAMRPHDVGTVTDKFRVIGGLHAVWCVFDLHSSDGRLHGYTPEALDHIIGWNGFAAALIAVQWLVFDGLETLAMPEFDAHNGKSAKRRAEDTKQKNARRKTDKSPHDVRRMSADDSDEVRTREEKRREEKKDLKDSPEKFGADIKPASEPVSDPDPEPDIETLFDAFWSAGMRKVEHKTARAAFERILKRKPDKTEFVAGLVADIRERIRRNQLGFDQMHPTTYLNGERWNDEQANLNGEHHAGSNERKPNDGIDWNEPFIDDATREAAERIRKRGGC